MAATAAKTYTCHNCGLPGFVWGWDYSRKRPVLMQDIHNGRVIHQCERKGIYPAKCTQCGAPDLVWMKHNGVYELTESYGLIHAEHPAQLQEISAGKCKYCPTPDLFWIREDWKYKLVDINLVKHACQNISPFIKDWREALRDNYAFEKKWVNSKKEGRVCGYCKGKGEKYLKHRSGKKMIVRRCGQCKGVGAFTIPRKKLYLKNLRKKYWPLPGTKIGPWLDRKHAKQQLAGLAAKIVFSPKIAFSP